MLLSFLFVCALAHPLGLLLTPCALGLLGLGSHPFSCALAHPLSCALALYFCYISRICYRLQEVPQHPLPFDEEVMEERDVDRLTAWTRSREESESRPLDWARVEALGNYGTVWRCWFQCKSRLNSAVAM